MNSRMSLKSIISVSCLSMTLLIPTANAADIISADDPDAILNVAKGFGSARLKTDASGDPFITGRINGSKYGIVFYGCNDGRDCGELQFAAAWGGIKVSMDDINTYNRKKKFGKAYLDGDGDPRLDMSVNVDYGVTIENLEDTFDWWTKAMKSFEKDVLRK